MAQDYKQTLNLPKDDFTIPMRANLPEQEPKWQQHWNQMDLYRLMQEKAAPKGAFILHDGPPYSNGDIHMGHALNKVLKDVIIRFRRLQGYRSPYVPGWDNHGMPIENAVSQQFIQQGKTADRVALREACRAYAKRFVDIQREQFRQLGCVGDWDRPYLTMDYGFEACIVRVFGELVQRGYIYRDMRAVLWCPTCETALAEAEVEYEEKISDSIYLRFPLLEDSKGVLSGLQNPYIVIWTTTPWTIPANMAVAVHPDFNYQVVQVDSQNACYLLVDSLVEATMSAVGIEDYRVVKNFKGRELEGIQFKHPLFERASPVVLANYVLSDEGTGVVHTAPGHGAEDFATGKWYNLTILSPVDGKGVFTDEAGEFAGLKIMPEGNKRIIERLQEVGHLMKHETYQHNYPHCWRCDSPLMFRTTVQWFMSIDHDLHRERSLEAIDQVKWFPEESRNRITAMVRNRPDWCISRQRAWGVGIPAFFCENCDGALVTPESVEAVASVIEREGSDVWYSKPASEILPSGTQCAHCGSGEFRKETDVLDVWFDSGSTHRAVLETRPELTWPSDLYFEGSDQHRGWFNSSLMIGIATKGASPFRSVVTHGFVLDGDGRKMSKSEGNTILPKDIMRASGADVLRLWTASVEYFEDVRYSDEILKYVVDAYRQIRNTMRFMLGNLYDFTPDARVPYDQLPELDRWMLARLQEFLKTSLRAYDSYEFHRFYQAARQLCNVDLSAFYLDVLKDRLYASAPNDPARRAAQTVMFDLTSVICRLFAPFLVHTMEEVWTRLPMPDKPQSVHLADFPEPQPQWENEALLNLWSQRREARDIVNRKVEEAKNEKRIPNPQSGCAKIAADPTYYDLLSPLGENLPRLFGISQAELTQGSLSGLEVEVVPAEGVKCARCWLVLPDVGSSPSFPDLCGRCATVIEAIS